MLTIRFLMSRTVFVELQGLCEQFSRLEVKMLLVPLSEQYLHLFAANLSDSACISETVQVISAVWQFGGRSGMIRQPQCRNWLHFYRIICRLSKNGRKKVYFYRREHTPEKHPTFIGHQTVWDISTNASTFHHSSSPSHQCVVRHSPLIKP